MRHVFTGLDNKSYLLIDGDLAIKVMENYRRYSVPMQFEREPRVSKGENS